MGVFKKLGEGIADLSQLQVQTFTGEIKSTIQATDSGNVLDWQKLIEEAKSDTAGSISLAAATNVKFDGDSDQFIADSASDRTLQAHSDAVDAARQVRQGLVETFQDLLGIE